jgi:hypothetical protein
MNGSQRNVTNAQIWGKYKTNRIMVATVPHVTSGSGLKISSCLIFVAQSVCTTINALAYYIRDSSSNMLGDYIRGVSKTVAFVASANAATVSSFFDPFQVLYQGNVQNSLIPTLQHRI